MCVGTLSRDFSRISQLTVEVGEILVCIKKFILVSLD